MKRIIFVLTLLVSLSSQAAPKCHVSSYLKSAEGKEKLSSLVERSKGLILSKLEELAIEENQVEIKAIYPKSAKDLLSTLVIKIKAKNLEAEGSSFTLTKVIREEDCGVEISLSGGNLLNKESGKNFGSLGKVKEFVRLN
jgi:hypothetical protein